MLVAQFVLVFLGQAKSLLVAVRRPFEFFFFFSQGIEEVVSGLENCVGGVCTLVDCPFKAEFF